MKTLKVHWEPDALAMIPLRVGRMNDTMPHDAEMTRGNLRRRTKLIVITETGAVLHQCTHPA